MDWFTKCVKIRKISQNITHIKILNVITMRMFEHLNRCIMILKFLGSFVHFLVALLKNVNFTYFYTSYVKYKISNTK
jgi:hypothetical protein